MLSVRLCGFTDNPQRRETAHYEAYKANKLVYEENSKVETS